MIDRLLKMIAPYHCYGCQKIGTTLCDNCKYDIVSEPFERCVNCLSLSNGNSGRCGRCRTPYQRSWAIGERSEVLEALLNGYKFSFERESARVLAGLLDAQLPQLPKDTIVTSIPTISQHIRQRGYDHAQLLGKTFAQTRQLPYLPTLQRLTSTKQLGATKRERIAQAKRAFSPLKDVNPETYLLIDDIFTTGSTMKYAAEALQRAGDDTIYIAVIARQTLD